MTNIEEQIADLKKQVEAIQQEIAQIEKEQREEKKESPWELCEVGGDGFCTDNLHNGTVSDSVRTREKDFNAFKSKKTAEGFSNAFYVMVALRQCEGLGFDEEGYGWVVLESGSTAWGKSKNTSLFSVYPPFKTKEHALVAYNKVGPEKVKAAYKFLATGE